MAIKRLVAIFCRELRRLCRDKDLRLLLFVAPLIGVLVFYGTYHAGAVRQIPTAVVDLDRSADSRGVLEDIQKAEELKVVAQLNSVSEMEELIKKGQVIVGITIPENFSRNISLGRSSRVLLVVDGSNIVYANNASTALLTITRTLGAQIGIKQLLAKGVNYSQAQKAYMAVTFDNQPWFNPTLNYAYFLVLALVLTIWQQCCTIASATGFIGEREVSSWYQVKASGVPKLIFFAGKAAARIFLYIAMLLPIYFVSFELLGQTPACGFFTLFMFSCIFAVAIDGLGFLVSSFAFNSVDATRFGMVVALPALVVSGYTWPLEAMPHWLQQAAWLIPHTWFFQGLNLIVFKDPGWPVVGKYFAALAVFAVVCYGAAGILVEARS